MNKKGIFDFIYVTILILLICFIITIVSIEKFNEIVSIEKFNEEDESEFEGLEFEGTGSKRERIVFAEPNQTPDIIVWFSPDYKNFTINGELCREIKCECGFKDSLDCLNYCFTCEEIE